jgi:hypothetical protein
MSKQLVENSSVEELMDVPDEVKGKIKEITNAISNELQTTFRDMTKRHHMILDAYKYYQDVFVFPLLGVKTSSQPSQPTLPANIGELGDTFAYDFLSYEFHNEKLAMIMNTQIPVIFAYIHIQYPEVAEVFKAKWNSVAIRYPNSKIPILGENPT